MVNFGASVGQQPASVNILDFRKSTFPVNAMMTISDTINNGVLIAGPANLSASNTSFAFGDIAGPAAANTISSSEDDSDTVAVTGNSAALLFDDGTMRCTAYG
jgi:hypothetical protein